MKKRFQSNLPPETFLERFHRRIYVLPTSARLSLLFRPVGITPGQICGYACGNRFAMHIDCGYRSLKDLFYEKLCGQIREDGEIVFYFKRAPLVRMTMLFGLLFSVVMPLVYGMAAESLVAWSLTAMSVVLNLLPSQTCRRILCDVLRRLACEEETPEEKYTY